MTHELTTLPSGVRVVTETLTDVRSVAVGLWVAVGSRDESAGQVGCSHFLEHLLFKGTSRRSARDIAETLDAVGGEMNAFTSKEVTCFHARVLDRDLPLAFEVLADMLVDARNDDPDVEAEREVVLSEIDIHLDTPDDLVHSDLAELVLADHPLAVETLGSAAAVRSLTREDIHAYYLERYRPEDLVVAAAGNLDHGRVVALADELLGDLGRPGSGRPARWAPGSYGEHQVRVRHRPTEQAHLAVGVGGLDQDDEDRWALRVLVTLLGGSMSSRLFQDIREQRGLAYSTYGYSASWTDGGMVAAYAGTSPGKVDEVLGLLVGQLDRVAEDVTAEEVARARGAMTGATVLGLEDTGSRMGRLGSQVATGGRLRTVDETLARVEAVTLDDVRRVAERVLQRPRDLAVVGPFREEESTRFTDALR